MTCVAGIVIDGGRGPKMYPESFHKGPCRFPYELLITFQPIILVHVDYSTFLCDVVPVLGNNQGRFPMVLPSLKWTLTPIMLLKLSLKPFV